MTTWDRLALDIENLLCWALKLDHRDPEGAAILRSWAAGKVARLAARQKISQKKIGVQGAARQKVFPVSDRHTQNGDRPP